MTLPGDASGESEKGGGSGTARRLPGVRPSVRSGVRLGMQRSVRRGVRPGVLAAARLPVLALLAAGAFLGEARAQATPDWIEGQWFDPRLHRCGEVHVRITVEGDTYRIWQETYGKTFPAAEGRILSRENGVIGVYNDSLGQTQQFRFVTPDAFVLERAENVGGATYVRCPGTGQTAPTG